MLYRRFGRTEAQLSAFSLGTMRLVRHSDVQVRRLLLTAFQVGITHLETAPAYGQSEVQLGRVLQSLWHDPTLEPKTVPLRSELVLTTKVSPLLCADDLWRGIEGSLTRLQLDTLDGLAFHGINLPEHLDHVQHHGIKTVQEAIAQGLIGYVGFSTHGSLDLILKAIETNLFSFVNLHYYYFNQRNLPAIEAAAAHDMGIFIISPADKGGRLYQPPQTLVDLCQPYSPLDFNYRFLLQDPRIHTLSLGAETPAEIHQALGCLTPDPNWHSQRHQIEVRLADTSQQRLGSDRCAQCYACLPCPVSIPIPEILRLRNLSVAYDMVDYGQYRYNMLGQAGHWFPGKKGDQCTECGDCLPRCPENLSIPQLLSDAHGRLNRSPLRRLWEDSGS